MENIGEKKENFEVFVKRELIDKELTKDKNEAAVATEALSKEKAAEATKALREAEAAEAKKTLSEEEAKATTTKAATDEAITTAMEDLSARAREVVDLDKDHVKRKDLE